MPQVEVITLDKLVPASHNYRQFVSIWNFSSVAKQLKKLEKDNLYKGYGLLRLFKCLVLQFIEDLSDRELERYLQENNAAKGVCEFKLSECTPDFSVFSKFRNRLATHFISTIFAELREQLKQQGLINEIFSFIDGSHLISKANLWKERDDALKKRYEKLNNETLPNVASDKEARIGCKGKDKYWHGYKKHTRVDMQSGLIHKVAVTAAKRNCHLRAIKKNNMPGKNKEQDRWFSSMRSPYERVFAHQNKRVRYRGIAKNQFAEFMKAICFNLKRLVGFAPADLALN